MRQSLPIATSLDVTEEDPVNPEEVESKRSQILYYWDEELDENEEVLWL